MIQWCVGGPFSLSLSDEDIMNSSQINKVKAKAKSSSIAEVAVAATADMPPQNPRVDAIIQKLQKAMMRSCRKNRCGNSSSSLQKASLLLLLDHLHHCLTVLHAKTTSLEMALNCLSHEIWPCFVTAVIGQLLLCNDNNNNTSTTTTIMIQKKKNNIQTLAYHFFMQLLRLHDGHILCESGECRHTGDVNMAQSYSKKNGFASQLNNNTNTASGGAATAATSTATCQRADGYTRLYRPDAVYSGASWDELMNESVGIWHRLQHSFSSTSSSMDWEDLVEERVPELNALMNEIENCKTMNQRAFVALMERINLGREVTQALQQQTLHHSAAAACRIKMRVNLRDKMEEFSLQIKKGMMHASTVNTNHISNKDVGNGGVIVAVTLQRRASAFQWNDPQGVLPMNFSARDWSKSLALPQLQSPSSSLLLQQSQQSQAAAAEAAPSALILAQNKSKKRRRRVILDDDSSSSDEKKDENHDKKSKNDGKTDAASTRNRGIEKENSNHTINKKQSKTSKSSTIQQLGQAAATGDHLAAGATGTGLLIKIDTTSRDAHKSDSGKNNSNNNNNTTSLTEIKKQSGVNVEALEAACLVVQAEEAETKRQAMAVDLMILDHDDNDNNNNTIHLDDDMMLVDGDGDNDDGDSAEILMARQQAKLKVQHFRAQLKKTLRKHSDKMTTTFTKAVDAAQGYHPPEYEVWDVRENLRLALMEAGNRYLFDETTTNTSRLNKTMQQQERQECLQLAMEYFNEAAECVVEQQALYKTMTTSNDDDDDDARVGPNLLFLHAQALTNKGIALLEQAKHLQTLVRQLERQESTTYNKMERRYLREAIHALESSLQQLQMFKTQSDMYTKTMKVEVEQETVLFDLFQAQELESLTHRTIACAFWHQGLFTKAVERFRIAGSICNENSTAGTMDGDNPMGQQPHAQRFDEMDNERIASSSSRELLEAELLVRIECFYAWTRLADLGNTFLEQSYKNFLRRCRGRLTDSDQAKAKKMDEEMYNTVQEALRHALSASKTIHEKVIKHAPPFVAQHLQDVVSERDVQTPPELETFLADSPEWWQNRQEEMSRLVQPLIQRNAQQQQQLQLPRNDVDARFTVDNFENENEAPKKRFVFTSDARRKNKKKRNVHGSGGGGVGYHTTGTHPSTTMTQKQHNFRPWGDELLPQVVDEISGQMVPKLPAVCMAPVMPPEIVAILQRQCQS